MKVELHGAESDFDLLVNATPSCVDPAAEVGCYIEAPATVGDLVVSPDLTPLLQRARGMGRQTIAGIDMSLHQLQRQFAIYTGATPDETLAREALADYLNPNNV